MQEGKVFRYPFRIYWEDTDASGVVYHANYIRFMERARSEALLEMGLRQNEMVANGAAFVVADLSIRYLKPAVLEDRLEVRTRITRLKRASMVFEQTIWRGDELLTSGTVRVGCISLDAKGPVPFPKSFYETFAPLAAASAAEQ